MSIGVTGAGRARGSTFGDAAGSNVTDVLGGGRLSLAFEDRALPIPPVGAVATDLRLVPELFAGFLADDVHAEGYVGAGLRGELDLASNRRSVNLRTGMYVAARAIAIGKHQDGAAEFVIGEYLERGAGRHRFGWEGGAMMRPRSHRDPSQARELDALMTIYIGWR